jgi:tetratricopeptide (TPR) repeat protein
MTTRSAIAAAAWYSLLACCDAAAADQYASLLHSKKYAEVETLANARLAHDPDDANALVAKAEAVAAMGPANRIDEAVRLGERCTATHPQHSACYLALGNALGAKAQHAGPMSAMSYAVRIRDAFTKAVELDPRNTDARFALLDYYLQAPALVGGGKGRARALAAQTETVNPAAARLMHAQLELADKDFAKAEATLLSVHPGTDAMVADRQRDLLVTLGHRYVADNKQADGERVFHILQNRFPDGEAESPRPGLQ